MIGTGHNRALGSMPPSAMPDRPQVPGSLERARALVEPAMRAAVGRLDPALRPAVAYHLGWADAEGNPVAGDGGKGVRPALAVLSAEAVGAASAVGVPGAVAVELVHNFSLMHDDVVDGDRERRHRPTVWALFGMGEAIIAGDALQTLAVEVLLDTGGRAAPRAAASLVRATQAMIAGQASDMAFESRERVSPEECTRMEAAKTGALLGFAASVGAELADATPARVDALREFGTQLGLAFQAIDDLLGIWGAPSVTGKPVASDLRSQKKSLPVVLALASTTPEADQLRALFANAPLDDAAVARAALLIEAAGARHATEERATRHLDAALAALATAEPVRSAHDDLTELAVFVTRREF